MIHKHDTQRDLQTPPQPVPSLDHFNPVRRFGHFYTTSPPHLHQGRPKTAGSAAGSRAEVLDVVALCCPGNRERPQIARVLKRTSGGYTVHWMSGSYGGPWAESRLRDGGKLVPREGAVQEADVIYRRIALTSGRKLKSRVAQTLRALYAAKDGKE